MDYFVGLDLGQSQDYSALSVVGRSERLSCGCGETLPPPDHADPGERRCPVCGEAKGRHYAVRHLKRWPLGTPYPQIVREVAELLNRPPLPGCQLAVDATGVGRAVVDLFRQARLPAALVPITITSGHQATREADGWHVAKKHLAGVLQVLLQQQRLKVAKLPERELLLKELRTFRVKISAATGNESFEAWRERDHDDIVLSVAMPCWLAERAGQPARARVLPFRSGVNSTRLRVVLCSREQLRAMAVESRHNCLLVSVADPGVAPPDSPAGFRPVDSLALEFADLDPADHEATWPAPVEPYGRPAGELAISRDQAKRLWCFLLRKRDPAADVFVVCDDDGRRAVSVAYAVCDALYLPRVATIFKVGDEDWRAGAKEPAPSRHVFETTRAGRALVM